MEGYVIHSIDEAMAIAMFEKGISHFAFAVVGSFTTVLS